MFEQDGMLAQIAAYASEQTSRFQPNSFTIE